MRIQSRLRCALLLAFLAGCNFQAEPPGICSLAIADTLFADSARPAALRGAIHAQSGPVSVSWRVLRKLEDVTASFRIEWTPPTGSALSWDLATQAHATLRDIGAPADTYTLVATLVDGDGITAVQRLGFRVREDSSASCKGANCNQPFPSYVSFSGLGQTSSLSAISLQLGVPTSRLVLPFGPASIDLLLQAVGDSLLLLSPDAAAAYDSAVAGWSVRNRTLIVPAPDGFDRGITRAQVLYGLRGATCQSVRISKGAAFLVQLVTGEVGWLQIEDISGSGASALVSITASETD